jgi:sarcosine oxidase subunit alpha
MPRLRSIEHPVTIQFDGEPLEAEEGEPIACALVAAGKLALARSPKFHRPRGPACFRGACDGCLARVDDAPNVMTCLVPARAGAVVKTQNTLGSREIDLLRVTDWFFPNGMNHHELFAGVPGLQGIMQSFARRVAGLGKLPAAVDAPRAAARRKADVVVVGGGAAGMAIAARAADKGRAVEVIEDGLGAGGTLGALGPSTRGRSLRERFTRAAASGAVRLRTSTTAAALYGDDLLVAGADGAEVVTARALVLAPGAHDGALAFEGNDLPGVMSARAAAWLAARDVVLGERVVALVTKGSDGAVAEAFARAIEGLGAKVAVEVARAEPLRAEGSSRVRSVVVRAGGAEQRLACDVLLVDAPRAPAYELCEQAGASLVHEPRGFVPVVDGGRVRAGVFALGEVTGAPFDLARFEDEAESIARAL